MLSKPTPLTNPEKVEALEDYMLSLPQAECPVIHHFGPGIYIREVHLPAGILAIGHAQKFKHLNIMLSGAIVMTGNDGKLKVLRAPLIFTGEPGRKFGYVLEDTIWQNVYATDERDVDILEDTYLDKSPTWQTHDDGMRELRTAMHDKDRDDFNLVLLQCGLTEEIVRSQSENTDDQIAMPDNEGIKVTVRDSYIEGKGVFLSTSAVKGERIGPARIKGMRTPLGRYTNHSKTPNSEFQLDGNGDIYLSTVRDVVGCVAGELGEEITVDYRQALSLSKQIKGDVL